MAADLKPIRTAADHEAALAEVLGRKRGLSIEMIRNLHDKLGIPAEVLIRPVRAKKAA